MNINTAYFSLLVLSICSNCLFVCLFYLQNVKNHKELCKTLVSVKGSSDEYNKILGMEKMLEKPTKKANLKKKDVKQVRDQDNFIL